MNTFTSTVGTISSRKDIEALSGPQLVQVYNELTKANVKRFADHKSGVARVAKAFSLWESQQNGATPSPTAVVSPEQSSYRPESKRGVIIELASKAGGATLEELAKATKWSEGEVRAALVRIEDYTGLKVTREGEGSMMLVTITGILRTRKAFSFPAKAEQRTHRPGTKRAFTLGLLQRPEGGTFKEIRDGTGWTERDAYEGVRLLHSYLGYGLRETADGHIFAFTK